MQVDVYTDFDAIPEDTARQLSVVSGLPFFRSLEWFRCLLRHGLAEGTPRLYVTRTAEALQCALYCLAHRDRLQSLTNFYTIEYGPVMHGPAADSGLREIISHIAAERPRWATFDLHNLHDTDLRVLVKAFASTGFALHPWNQTRNWYLDVDGRSFEQYYSALSSRMRNTIQRKSRKTEREHELRLAIYPGEGLTLDEAIAHYQAIYAASWKQAEPFPDFMPELFKVCDAQHLARVGLAWVDGEPAAAQFWIRDQHGEEYRSIIYKLAYDEKFGPLSIGSMLSLQMFQHALDVDHIAQIDYGVGDEKYKRDWMSASRGLSGLLACNKRTIRGQLKNLREIAATRLRRR